MKVKRVVIIGALVLVVLVSVLGGAISDRLFGFKPLDFLVKRQTDGFRVNSLEQKILNEESIVISVAEEVSPSVVTVSIKTPQRSVLQYDLFGGLRRRVEGGVEQDIGTGFIISEDGLIVTNKHVVSDSESSYKVVTKDDDEYDVKQISRDPLNDLAILKVDANGLKPASLGDSGNLKVGQFVVAIGTALGEFRHTVTTGVISGLGRGITAGDPFEGSFERLDDVIQTDAAINPGNSGGPLLNSAGQVIGVNVAVAQSAQNIGFAIPINVVKKALDQFNKTGKFLSKPFLGVQYQTIPKDTAILNNVPEGAYIVEVVPDSPAEKAGVKAGDIVTKIDGEELGENKELSDVIGSKVSGNIVSLDIWRDGQTLNLSATLSEFSE